ncbi:hypothetical protein E3N88_00164 [Mikania micrantha]|uniref:Uncharacterized protein n=1 Tax=Mikania micrantha TaxID=192012 RepID=A0A5N6PZE4_9ASTR|nr:hypothetical protein E3N88_00164 [Mikania micrantha]
MGMSSDQENHIFKSDGSVAYREGCKKVSSRTSTALVRPDFVFAIPGAYELRFAHGFRLRSRFFELFPMDKRPCSEENQALDGISAFSEQIPRCALTTVRLLARPCLTPRVNFRDLAENGNCENRPRPKVEHCSTLHDRAPMVHDRAKFQNFYKLSFSPHFKGLDFLEPKFLLCRFLEAV